MATWWFRRSIRRTIGAWVRHVWLCRIFISGAFMNSTGHAPFNSKAGATAGRVSLAGKVTNFNLYHYIERRSTSTNLNVCRVSCGGCGIGGGNFAPKSWARTAIGVTSWNYVVFHMHYLDIFGTLVTDILSGGSSQTDKNNEGKNELGQPFK